MITLKYKKGQELNKMLILRDIMQYIPSEQFETINKSNSIIPETKMIVKNDCIISFEIKFLSNERKSVRKHEQNKKLCDARAPKEDCSKWKENKTCIGCKYAYKA